MSFSKVTILGNLGADAELRYMPNGNPVTSFSVCANDRRGSGDNRTEKQNWFKVNLFGNSAEAIAQHLTKGTTVFVEGRIKPELWKGRDGETRLTMNVDTTDVQLVGGKRSRSAEAGGESEAAPGEGQVAEDDVPF